MRGRNLNLIAFLLIVATISYYDMKKCHRLPWPPRFIFAGLTFLLMEIVGLVDETLSGVTAIGFVIGIFLKDGFVATCKETQATGQPQNVQFVGDYTGPQGDIASVSEYQSATTQTDVSGIQPGPGLVT